MRFFSGSGLACRAALAVAFFGLVACSAGRASSGFVDPQLMRAYIPLSTREYVFFGKWAAATTVAPGVAVTNDHNLNLIAPDRVLARSRDYDLLFFKTDATLAAKAGAPKIGEQVIAYGQGATDNLREARGAIVSLDEHVVARCPDCREQRTMIFDAPAGGGFSGGPVVDAKNGALLGITFGYLDGKGADGTRRMYAYDIDLVMAEMRRLLVAGR